VTVPCLPAEASHEKAAPDTAVPDGANVTEVTLRFATLLCVVNHVELGASVEEPPLIAQDIGTSESCKITYFAEAFGKVIMQETDNTNRASILSRHDLAILFVPGIVSSSGLVSRPASQLLPP
jgi:hypothetical protein